MIKVIKYDAINGYYYSWINEETPTKDAGEMRVFISTYRKGSIDIGNYKKNKGQPPSIGYEFIKICIADILNNGYDVISINDYRNKYSNTIWDKLSNEFDVIDDEIQFIDINQRIIIKKIKLIKNN